MTAPISLADVALARRLERAEALGCVDYARAMAALGTPGETEVEPLAGGFMVFAGAGGPLSRAAGLGMTVPLTAADLDRVESFYARLGGPAQVDVCPYADRSLIDLLGARRYRISEFNNVLVRPLENSERQPPPPAGIEIRAARPEEADVWSETVAAGFAGEDEVAPELIGVARPLFSLASGTPFIALVDGYAAGGGILTLRDGLAGLFGTSTLPAFRNRGVQTALIRARLARAATAGALLAVCYTLPGTASQRNVERLGFRVAYTKLVMVRDVAAG